LPNIPQNAKIVKKNCRVARRERNGTGYLTTLEEKAGASSVIAFEFVIGVTGHRDLVRDDVTALTKEIFETLDNVRRNFTHLPVRLVTGLAEGADTLAAEVALDMGLPVTAVLPMPLGFYEQDFGEAGLKRLRELLSHERMECFEMPIAEENMGRDVLTPQDRVIQYEMLMDFLNRRSNVLLALWDGRSLADKAGTFDVIRTYLSGRGHHQAPAMLPTGKFSFEDCGELAIWIKTRREKNPGDRAMEAAAYLVSDASGSTFQGTADIPQDFINRWKGLESYAADRFSDVGTNLPAWPLARDDGLGGSSQAHAINIEFLRADQLAMANQKNSDGLFKAFGLIAGAMGLCFLVYAKLADLKIFLILYVGLFGLGYVLFKISAARHWLGKHLSYRALAETIRVQYFLLVSGAGAGFNVRRVMNLTSVNRFQRFEWLPDAARCMEPVTYEHHKPSSGRMQAVHDHWIEDQSSYFSKKLHQLHHRHERLEVIKAALLLGSVLGALALLLFKYEMKKIGFVGFSSKTWLVFLMGLLPLWLAIWELYQGKMATRELIWQYANQRHYFTAAKAQMAACKTPETQLRIVSDLAERALAEIYLWSAHRFHREHEPPAAG
jgi:hypothetical protein